MSFIHKGDFGFEVCWGLGGGGWLVWPGRCARPGFGSLVQSLLPKDTLLGAFLKPTKNVLMSCQSYFCILWALISIASPRRFNQADSTSNSEAHRISGNLKR